MSDAPNSKVKGVSFNLDNEIEKYIFDYTCEMKDRKQSFSQLIKHLLIGYLINIGKPPPGIAQNNSSMGSPMPLEEKQESKRKTKVPMNMPYAIGRD